MAWKVKELEWFTVSNQLLREQTFTYNFDSLAYRPPLSLWVLWWTILLESRVTFSWYCDYWVWRSDHKCFITSQGDTISASVCTQKYTSACSLLYGKLNIGDLDCLGRQGWTWKLKSYWGMKFDEHFWTSRNLFQFATISDNKLTCPIETFIFIKFSTHDCIPTFRLKTTTC